MRKEREAKIQAELYRSLKNLINKGFKVNHTTFSDVLPEESLPSGKRPDLLVTDSKGKKWLVIETKKLNRGKESNLIDPFSSAVIKQASDYAIEI
ncbi:MAG: hypothetical protein GOV15_00115, partial [Candidatus Diapherotrites archaeon]|nr:hypothetical protein [Candidatus Diapherotrites archaeon]